MTEAQAQEELARTALDRLTLRAPCGGLVLSVQVRPGESAPNITGKPLILLARTTGLFVRVDLDEYDLPRFRSDQPASARAKGESESVLLRFVRIEPVVVPKPKRNGPHDQVDSRVLQVIYEIDTARLPALYIGQQLDVFIQTEHVL